MSHDLPLADLRVLMFVGDDYEDLELWYPKLRLAEAGARRHRRRSEGRHRVSGKARLSVPIGCRRSRCMECEDFDGVVIPGGFMPDKLRREDKVKRLVREFAEAEKLVAAICHGGWIPISAGVYRGVRVTGSPGIKDDLSERRRDLGRCAGRRRSPLRLEPQAG